MTVEAAGFCTHLPNMPTRKSGFVAWQQCNQEFKTKTEVAFSHRQPQVLWCAGDTVANCMASESEGVFNNRLNCLDVHGLTGPFRLSFLRLPADHGSLNIAWAVDDHFGRPLVSPILFDGNNFMNVKLNYFTGLRDGYWHPTDASAETCESKHSVYLAVDAPRQALNVDVWKLICTGYVMKNETQITLSLNWTPSQRSIVDRHLLQDELSSSKISCCSG